MGLDILGIADSALSAFQTGIAISSKNIADSSDPNYNRETLEVSTMLGGDLNIDVRRISNHFLASQVNHAQADMSQYDTSTTALSSIDDFITGLNGSDGKASYNMTTHNMQAFFDSLSTLSTHVSGSTKEAVISQATLLSKTMNDSSQYLDKQKNNAEHEITDSITQINSLAQQIAKLNEKVSKISGTPSPDLLDQRDRLVNQLSQYVGVTVVEKDKMLNVSISTGSSLVSGENAAKLATKRDGFGDKRELTINGVELSSPDKLSGKIAGLFDLNNNLIPQVQQKLGLIASTLAYKFNEQNKAGYLSSSTTASPVSGGAIFNPDISTNTSNYENAISNADNTGDAALGVQIDDPTKLKPSSYTITEVSSGSYRIINDDTGTVETFSSFPFTTAEGLKISSQSGSSNVGDSYKVNLFEHSAGDIGVTANSNGIALSDSADGKGNGNINALANLGNQAIFNGANNSFTEQLASSFSEIGAMAKDNANSYNASKATYTQANNDKQSLSGVNVQEEYTNIIHFQQSYSAAAKVVSADEKMFSSVLAALG